MNPSVSRTALITGGSGGIGLELTKLLLQDGYAVHSLDLAPAPNLPGLKGYSVDIRDAKALHSVVASIEGSIDLLINNAGIMRRGNLLESEDIDIDLLIDIHVKGSLRVFRAAHPKLRDDAVVFQMVSRHGITPPINPGLYGLSKQCAAHVGGLIQRTFPRLKVKLAFPGPIDTPLGRFGVSEEALIEKKKIMDTPEALAARLHTLIHSKNHTCLNFDQKSWQYVFEEAWPVLSI